MRAEYIIGLEALCFLLGWFVRDIGTLGAAPPPERDRADGRQPRSTAPKHYSRKPW